MQITTTRKVVQYGYEQPAIKKEYKWTPIEDPTQSFPFAVLIVVSARATTPMEVLAAQAVEESTSMNYTPLVLLSVAVEQKGV